MRKSLRKSLFAVGLVFLMMYSGLAQQVASIDQLKQQIREMEVIDSNSSTSPAVKTKNRKFLNDRRLQLRAALAREIANLQKYDAEMTSLTPEERKDISATIELLTRDLAELKSEMK